MEKKLSQALNKENYISGNYMNGMNKLPIAFRLSPRSPTQSLPEQCTLQQLQNETVTDHNGS